MEEPKQKQNKLVQIFILAVKGVYYIFAALAVAGVALLAYRYGKTL